MVSPTSLTIRRSDIRYALESRERGWLRRRAFTAAFGNRTAGLLATTCILFMLLLPLTEIISRTLGMKQSTLFMTFLVLAGSLLLLAIGFWRSTYRWAVPVLLLQIDRCGCCGNSLASRRKANGALPTTNLSARCSECGAEWSAGIRVGYVDRHLEHLCDAA